MQKINIHKWYLVRSALSSSFTHFLKNWKIFVPWNDIDKNAKVIFSHFWGLFEVEFRPTWHDIMLCNSCDWLMMYRRSRKRRTHERISPQKRKYVPCLPRLEPWSWKSKDLSMRLGRWRTLSQFEMPNSWGFEAWL